MLADLCITSKWPHSTKLTHGSRGKAYHIVNPAVRDLQLIRRVEAVQPDFRTVNTLSFANDQQFAVPQVGHFEHSIGGQAGQAACGTATLYFFL